MLVIADQINHAKKVISSMRMKCLLLGRTRCCFESEYVLLIILYFTRSWRKSWKIVRFEKIMTCAQLRAVYLSLNDRNRRVDAQETIKRAVEVHPFKINRDSYRSLKDLLVLRSLFSPVEFFPSLKSYLFI